MVPPVIRRESPQVEVVHVLPEKKDCSVWHQLIFSSKDSVDHDRHFDNILLLQGVSKPITEDKSSNSVYTLC